jgi:hypothetical protein
MASVLSTAGVNANKFFNSQSDAGREQVLKISADAGILDAELLAIYRALTQPAGTGYDYSTRTPDTDGPDAFTVAAVGTAAGAAFVAGTTTVVYMRVQGTGALSTSALKTAAEAANGNSTTFTITVEAVFAPLL